MPIGDPIQCQRTLAYLFKVFDHCLFNGELSKHDCVLTVEQFGEQQEGVFWQNHTVTTEELKTYQKMVLEFMQNAANHAGEGKFKDPHFDRKVKEMRIPFLAINTLHLKRPLIEVAAILVHQMCHLWQLRFGGKAPKGDHHNTEWADQMERIGLTPVCLDTPRKTKSGKAAKAHKDKRVGRKVVQLVVAGGAFEKAFKENCESIKLPWGSVAFPKPAKKTSKKLTYACSCGRKFYASKELDEVLCGKCEAEFKMEESEEEETSETLPERKIEPCIAADVVDDDYLPLGYPDYEPEPKRKAIPADIVDDDVVLSIDPDLTEEQRKKVLRLRQIIRGKPDPCPDRFNPDLDAMF